MPSDLKEGEFVAIMGPSGCGKSTLLNILGLLDNPTEGSYKLFGQEVADLKEKERTRVRKGQLGFVFQSFNLIDELNVYENVELPLTYLGVKAGERKRMVDDILKRMNIGHRAKHFPQQLSGGQQHLVFTVGCLDFQHYTFSLIFTFTSKPVSPTMTSENTRDLISPGTPLPNASG